MMKASESFRYAEGQNVQAVELPYDGRELAMVILLPKAGEFEAFETALDTAKVNDLLNKLARRQVALSMPRFKIESQFSLAKTLAALGMRRPLPARQISPGWMAAGT